jgi:subtilisin family serine protease/PKD repeat protein
MRQRHQHVRLFASLVFAFALAAPAPAVVTPDDAPGRDRKHRPDELLVKFKPGVVAREAESIARGQGALEVHEFRRPRRLQAAPIDAWRLIRLGKGADLRKVRAALLRNPRVEAVEYNDEVRVALTPNDPRYPELWGLNNIGQTGGRVDADLDAPEAWDVQTGSQNVVVAVIDTGVDYTHPDLAANIWTNPGEIPGNGIDDDGNGYVDDVHGYDFCNADNDPRDDHGHGTHVAGTIAAVGNNGVGVTGVSWSARIMAVKFLCAGGSGTTSAAISAVLYAADMDAKVMNNSWGGGGFNTALLDAITTADQAGALFVAAAGNNGADNDLTPHYPSSYEAPNVLAVAATDLNDARAFFSNYGATSVHLGAPGASILSSVPPAGDPCCSDPSGYKLLNGTSMATPHVSGAAALAFAQFPGITHHQAKLRLMSGADPVPALAGITVTGGRLNARNALDDDSVPPAPVANLVALFSGARSIMLEWAATGDDGMSGTATAYDIRYSTAPIDESNFQLAARVANPPKPAAPGTTQQFKVRGLAPLTTYYVALKVLDNVGNASALSNLVTATTLQLGTLFRDDFEAGAGNWTVEGSDGAGGPALWHLSTHRFASPSNAFYYGKESTLTYDTGARNFGSITSVPIDLGQAQDTGLAFAHYLRTENFSPFDTARVQVSSDDGASWSDLYVTRLSTAEMTTVTLDLSAYDGRVIRLRFSFDTVDSISNFFEGWVVDDVVLTGVTGLPNQPPTANAGGPYSGFRNQPVAFNGAASSDPDGNPLTYAWNFGDGATGVGARPTHVYAASGVYTVTLVVSDGLASSAPATTTVTVTNRAPVANPGGPYPIRFKNEPLTFDGTRSFDPDGSPLLYKWNFADGSTGSGPTPTHAYTSPGNFNVTLVVNDGETDSTPATVTVTVVNQAPFANAGPDQTVKGRTLVRLDGTGSFDPDGLIAAYNWKQHSGTNVVTLSGANTANPTFTTPGVKGQGSDLYVFELIVTDNDGKQSFSDLVQINVTK